MVGSDLVKRYLKDLDHQEDDLTNTRNKIEELEAEDAKIDALFKQFKFEVVNDARKEREALVGLFFR